MIRSMTGFGDASVRENGIEHCVEIKSVNNKYFKAIMRLPESLQPLEPEFEIATRRRLERGTVTLSISISDTSERAAFQINHAALDHYVEQIKQSKAVKGDDVRIDLGPLLDLPGVLQPPGDEEGRIQSARAVLLPLIEKACDELIDMRNREGADLARDLMEQHDYISAYLERVAAHAPTVVREYENRLRSRIETLLADAEMTVDRADLVREIAVYAEKTDIAEEITRLRGHLRQFSDRIKGNDGSPIGRTLEFLTQEMLREANTMASKSPSAEVSRLIVEIKGAIDRIKEQVLNVA
ncbi:MAG: YicC family protein [Phycisphaeraceae bacterium]|nr:MAG: YicC family protein [Phycisphaeraceae bacterium]